MLPCPLLLAFQIIKSSTVQRIFGHLRSFGFGPLQVMVFKSSVKLIDEIFILRGLNNDHWIGGWER
jgi:hypothetical protein